MHCLGVIFLTALCLGHVSAQICQRYNGDVLFVPDLSETARQISSSNASESNNIFSYGMLRGQLMAAVTSLNNISNVPKNVSCGIVSYSGALDSRPNALYTLPPVDMQTFLTRVADQGTYRLIPDGNLTRNGTSTGGSWTNEGVGLSDQVLQPATNERSTIYVISAQGTYDPQRQAAGRQSADNLRRKGYQLRVIGIASPFVDYEEADLIGVAGSNSPPAYTRIDSYSQLASTLEPMLRSDLCDSTTTTTPTTTTTTPTTTTTIPTTTTTTPTTTTTTPTTTTTTPTTTTTTPTTTTTTPTTTTTTTIPTTTTTTPTTTTTTPTTTIPTTTTTTPTTTTTTPTTTTTIPTTTTTTPTTTTTTPTPTTTTPTTTTTTPTTTTPTTTTTTPTTTTTTLTTTTTTPTTTTTTPTTPTTTTTTTSTTTTPTTTTTTPTTTTTTPTTTTTTTPTTTTTTPTTTTTTPTTTTTTTPTTTTTTTTTPTTTTTTPWSTGPPPYNPCSDCTHKSGSYLVPSEKGCDQFVKCVSDMQGGYIAYYEDCGPGTLYNEQLSICGYPNDFSCPAWPPCTQGVSWRYAKKCCGSYWQCSNQQVEEFDCTGGMVFSSNTKQCETSSNSSCLTTSPCPGRQSGGECYLRPVEGKPCSYNNYDPMSNRSQYVDCPGNMGFSQEACGCYNSSVACPMASSTTAPPFGNSNSSDCRAFMYLPLNSASGFTTYSEYTNAPYNNYIDQNTVTIENDHAVFNGEEGVNKDIMFFPFFSKRQYKDSWAAKMQIQIDQNAVDTEYILLSNDRCTECNATFRLRMMRNSPSANAWTVMFWVRDENNREAEIAVTVPITNPAAYTSILVMVDKTTIKGYVTPGGSSTPMEMTAVAGSSNTITREVKNSDCGIAIGQGRVGPEGSNRTVAFDGNVKEFKMYECSNINTVTP